MDTIREVQRSHEELAANLASQGVEYVFGSFIDVCGRAKSKCVPVSHLPELLAGHERYTPRGLGGLGHDDARRGRVRSLARPVHPVRPAVGPPLRLYGGRPILRRHASPSPSAPGRC